MTLRVEVDGVQYAFDEESAIAVIRAGRQAVSSWDTDQPLDDDSHDSAITDLDLALEHAEDDEPENPVCAEQGHVMPGPLALDDSCARCGGIAR